MKELIAVFCLFGLASIPSLGQTADDFLSNGNAQFNQQDYAGAIEWCSRALAINPNFPLAYYNRGTAYLKLNRFAEAVADLTGAITLNPTYTAAYYYRGYAYSKLQKPGPYNPLKQQRNILFSRLS
jgi:tetratricopeptide (TPR) repeat protein